MGKVIGVIIFIVLFIWFMISVISGINNFIDALANGDESFRKNVGKSIVLDGDTLMIIDYSYINSTYTLQNKTVVNYLIVDSLLIK